MRWNHLPVAGGIYDQHPDLLTQWRIIWEEKSIQEKREADKAKKGTKSPKLKGR